MDEFLSELRTLLLKHRLTITGRVRQPNNFDIYGCVRISGLVRMGEHDVFQERMFKRITATEMEETDTR